MSAPSAEAVLCAAYQEEAALYRQALALTADIQSTLHQGGNAEAALQHVLTLLNQVGAIEARIAPVKAQYHGGGAKPGSQLHDVLQELRQIVERLAEGIGEAERVARERKSRLEPELDAIIRSSQMQRAYGGWR
jgi:hypothetical protein